MRTTFSNTLSRGRTSDPLPCGCIVGYFACPELQRIDSLKNDAYYRSDWVEYEKYRRLSWKHIGMEGGGVGIEIEEKYCEIAAKRCSQSVMRLDI